MNDFNSYDYNPYEHPENEVPPKKPKKKTLWVVLIIVAAVLILGTISILMARCLMDSGKPTESPSVSQSEETKPSTGKEDPIGKTEPGKITATVLDLSGLVEEVIPSVVSITDTLLVSQSYNPYNYFFSFGSQEPEEQVAAGSGVIYSQIGTDLYIVTNAHVVNNESSSSYQEVSSKGLKVTFCDGTTADAKIKGMDVASDLALVIVDLTTLSQETKNQIKIATIGSSDNLKLGSGVLAIGNAAGYGQSVTTGILSAKDREVTIDNITRRLLQTDAAINPGNSGGGLFDMTGNLVGINCAKTVSTDIEGMCFAIPITSAVTKLEALMNASTYTKEEQGYLGINFETVPSNYVSDYGYPQGVLVTRIMDNTSTADEDIQIYDIITAVNDVPVTTTAEFSSLLRSYPAGMKVTLTISRPDGRKFREFKTDVTLISYEDISSKEKISEEDNEDLGGGDLDSFFRRFIFGR